MASRNSDRKQALVTSGFPTNPAGSVVLKWDVFVTPGIPIVMSDRPPGAEETYFQAMASTLIYGKKDAVLVDAYMTAKQAEGLANWIASKGRNLTTIYINAWSWRSLVRRRHASRTLPQRQSGRNGQDD
jgi:hypothetical protein